MQDDGTTDTDPPLHSEVVYENKCSTTEHLQAALTADSKITKNYHVRAALQALVVEETAPD